MTVAEFALHGSHLNGRDLRQSFNELQNRLFSLMTDYDANIIQNFTSTNDFDNDSCETTQVSSVAATVPTIDSVEKTNRKSIESKPIVRDNNNILGLVDNNNTNHNNNYTSDINDDTQDTTVTMTKLSSSLERKKLVISSQRARQNITFIKRVITATTKNSDTANNTKLRSVNTTKLVIDTSTTNNDTKKLGGKSSPEHIEKLIGKEVTTPRKVTTPFLTSTPTVKKTSGTNTSTPIHKVNYATPSKSLNTTTSTPIGSKAMSRTPRPSKDPSDKIVKPSGLPNKLSLDMPPPTAKPTTKNITKLSFDSAVKRPQQAGEENKSLRQSTPMESTKLFGLINSKSTMAMTPIKSSVESITNNEEKISPKRVAENPFMSLVTSHTNH